VPSAAAGALTVHLARIARSEGFEFHRLSAEMRVPRAPDAGGEGPQPL